MERGGTQGIQFIVQSVLARLVSPEQFGTIAIVMVFISLARVFVQSGFNTALIQKKDADEIDFSSVYYLSVAISLVIYFIIYLSAPFIAEFYNDQSLIPILRVLSLTLFFGPFNSIQNAYIARHLMFKKLFVSSLGAVLFSGILGILASYQGFGVSYDDWLSRCSRTNDENNVNRKVVAYGTISAGILHIVFPDADSYSKYASY